MASANAMAKMDCTKILVDAPGLRPTASEAIMPIRPTLIAAPKAASPTCKFPLIRVSFLRAGNHECVRAGEISLLMVCGSRGLFVLAHQHREHCRQQHKDQRLNQSHD